MATITGTSGNDTLVGTAGDDQIEGGGGIDTIDGAAGNDIITGGSDYNRLRGGVGNDRLTQGDDGGAMYGDAGDDTLIGGAGSDTIYDGSGNDSVSGGGGDDYLYSTSYQDSAGSTVNASGSDVLNGGAGNDTISIERYSTLSNEVVTAVGASGTDHISVYNYAQNQTYRLVGDEGNDTFVLYNYGSNSVFDVDGGTGNDTFNINDPNQSYPYSNYVPGAFTVKAGVGNDLVVVQNLYGSLSVTLGAGSDILRFGANAFTPPAVTVSDFESGATGDQVDVLTYLTVIAPGWDQRSNPFASGYLRLVQSGSDTLLQLDRDAGGSQYSFTTLVTLQNVDAAALAGYNLGGFPSDGSTPPGATITGTPGFDTLVGTAGDDQIDGGAGVDTIDGGPGSDTIMGGSDYNTLRGGIGGDRITQGDNGGAMYGDAGDDTLIGGAGIDTIYDGPGNDVVSGGAGNDSLYSGSYQDISGNYIYSSGSDVLNGGDGPDYIGIERYSNTANEVVTAVGAAGSDTINVYSYAQNETYRLVGDDGNDIFVLNSYGSNGVFDLDGGSGNDTFNINDPNQNYPYSTYVSGVFTVKAGAGNDLVVLQNLYGSLSVVFGEGSDTLRFGGNAFTPQLVVVSDFESGPTGDQVDILTYLAVIAPSWAQSSNPFASGYLRLVQSGSDTLLQLDRDAGGSQYSFTTLVTLQNVDATTLTAYNLGGFPSDGGTPPGATITGTSGDDTLVGTVGDDQIDGGAGTDIIDGGAGNDMIMGGSGYNRLRGGIGNDRLMQGNDSGVLYGDAGDDTLIGGAVSDTIYDGPGNDVVSGGGGDDYLYSTSYQDSSGSTVNASGSDVLNGGDGSDTITIERYSSVGNEVVTAVGASGSDFINVYSSAQNETYRLVGDDGNDIFSLYSYGSNGVFDVDGGAGNDTFNINDPNQSYPYSNYVTGAFTVKAGAGNDLVVLQNLYGSLSVTLGTGSDILRFGDSAFTPQAVTVSDFESGAAGDQLDVTAYLAKVSPGWEQSSNPFASGYLRLVQSGNDTLLQLDRDAGGSQYSFTTLVTLQNVNATTLTAYNLGGYESNVMRGTSGADTLTGTSGDDIVDAGGGNDFVSLKQGGEDVVSGGAGNDAVYFGAAFSAGDKVDGGVGADVVALQGNYSALVTLTGESLKGIETLSILTHSDTRFGGDGASGFSYNFATIDATVAAGTQLIVNASTLEAGENLTFDGHLETDGSFFIYGGQGTDDLKGGNGGDVFFFGENGRFVASDHVDGGAGADILVLRGDYTLVLGDASLTNVETVTLMSGSDARFAPIGTAFHYDITTANDTVAAGATMTFNGGGLAAGETLHFDGSAETDGAFRIFGGAAGDTIIGGAGSDLLFGGLGADPLTGGGGNDTFRYQAVGESTAASMDQILDFSTGDHIDLSRVAHFNFIGSGAFGGHAGELRVENVSGDIWQVQADADGDGAADFMLQVAVADGHSLESGDFNF